MKFNRFSSVMLAGAITALLGSTAAYADMTDYTQLKDSVTNQLNTLGVATDEIGKLSINQLAQLTSTLTGKENDGVKAASADFMIQEFLHPMEMTTDSAEGKALQAKLTADLEKIGVAYPAQKLTTTEMQALVNAINNSTTIRHGRDAKLKQSIEAVLAMMSRPASVTTTNEGVVQLEEQMNAKLTEVGLTAPPKGSLTFDQLGKLEGIFATTGEAAQMKADAAKVLNPN